MASVAAHRALEACLCSCACMYACVGALLPSSEGVGCACSCPSLRLPAHPTRLPHPRCNATQHVSSPPDRDGERGGGHPHQLPIQPRLGRAPTHCLPRHSGLWRCVFLGTVASSAGTALVSCCRFCTVLCMLATSGMLGRSLRSALVPLAPACLSPAPLCLYAPHPAVVTPLILPFGLAYFLMWWPVWRYQML